MKKKLDSKYRIVIPREMREELYIKKGSFVDLKMRDGEIYIKRTIKPPKTIKEIEGQLMFINGLYNRDNMEYHRGYRDALLWVLSKENN